MDFQILKINKATLWQLCITVVTFLFITLSHAKNPVWKFIHHEKNPPNVTIIIPTGYATIKYTVINESYRKHTLVMKPIAGVTQQVISKEDCPKQFTLDSQESCILNLFVDGSKLTHSIKGGPVVCQQANKLECYQPSLKNSLNITARPKTLYAGTANGHVYFSSDNGTTWATQRAPSPGSAVNSVFATPSTLYVGSADGKVYYSDDNGGHWGSTTPTPDGSSVNSIFVVIDIVPIIYAGTENGDIYYSTDTINWTEITSPSPNKAVNGMFITPGKTIYIGSEDGNVYYLVQNDVSWNKITGPNIPSSSVPIHNIFATNSQLYVNTRLTSTNDTLPQGTINFEYAYLSDGLTNPINWTLFSQITYTLFVNSDASVIQAGTQDGYVFSLTSGNELGFITYSPINGLFFLE